VDKLRRQKEKALEEKYAKTGTVYFIDDFFQLFN
jgi:hypothetical protein